MKKLILIRHAKSDWHSDARSDFERPLNDRGKQAAPLIGSRLAKRNCRPDVLISSPAKRASSTAKRIAREIDYPAETIVYDNEIYEACLNTLLRLVNNLDDRYTRVMLIGHNPGFSELGEWFTSAAPDWLPTCGLLELELPVDSWAEIFEGCATLARYDYPKKTS